MLVAGPRSSGKRTMISAFVDLINHTRRDHVITIESEINIVHERGRSFISQREVRGSYDDVLTAARAALREDPDVLVIEICARGADERGARSRGVGAARRRRILGAHGRRRDRSHHRPLSAGVPRQVQLALAENLRGVVAQVLLRKPGGGRLAAREVLLNTPAVASVIAEGKTSQLPMAIEGGRRYGMMPLNDALVGFVQSGAVDVREAYRRSTDRAGFLALLKRKGVDTTSSKASAYATAEPQERLRTTFQPLPPILPSALSYKPLQLLQQKRQHVVFGQLAGSAERLAPTRSRGDRGPAGAPDTCGWSPVVSSNSSMKSSALRSDIRRTLPAGVNTLNSCPSARRTWRPAGTAARRCCRGTARSPAPPRRSRARRSAACCFARSIV